MSDETFDKCYALLGLEEGGFVVDNGGPTNFGITQRVARKWGYNGLMQDLPQDIAKQIAKEEYWDQYKCGMLPLPVAYQVFDAVYNGGTPVRWLQMICKVTVDGVIGSATVSAVSTMNLWEVVAKMNAQRLRYLASLKQPQYSGGRFNRIADCLDIGGSLV